MSGENAWCSYCNGDNPAAGFDEDGFGVCDRCSDPAWTPEARAAFHDWFWVRGFAAGVEVTEEDARFIFIAGREAGRVAALEEAGLKLLLLYPEALPVLRSLRSSSPEGSN